MAGLTAGGVALSSQQRQDMRFGIGLGNVNNTADVDKPVSTAQAAALNGKMPLRQNVTNIEYAASGPNAGKMIAYRAGTVDHTITYSPNQIVDEGGGVTLTVTLDEQGRPTGRIYS